jgi:hypothetical protein
VPGTGTIDIVPCRARVVLFRTVLVPAHRARAKWPGIVSTLYAWHFKPTMEPAGKNVFI